MSWTEDAPDAIVDEFARAIVDFLALWASAAASASAKSPSIPVSKGLVRPRG